MNLDQLQKALNIDWVDRAIALGVDQKQIKKAIVKYHIDELHDMSRNMLGVWLYQQVYRIANNIQLQAISTHWSVEANDRYKDIIELMQEIDTTVRDNLIQNDSIPESEYFNFKINVKKEGDDAN